MTLRSQFSGTTFDCKYLPVLNINRSVRQVVENIQTVVLSKCSIDTKQVSANVVIIRKNDLIQFLENRQGFSI